MFPLPLLKSIRRFCDVLRYLSQNNNFLSQTLASVSGACVCFRRLRLFQAFAETYFDKFLSLFIFQYLTYEFCRITPDTTKTIDFFKSPTLRRERIGILLVVNLCQYVASYMHRSGKEIVGIKQKPFFIFRFRRRFQLACCFGQYVQIPGIARLKGF